MLSSLSDAIHSIRLLSKDLFVFFICIHTHILDLLNRFSFFSSVSPATSVLYGIVSSTPQIHPNLIPTLVLCSLRPILHDNTFYLSSSLSLITSPHLTIVIRLLLDYLLVHFYFTFLTLRILAFRLLHLFVC